MANNTTRKPPGNPAKPRTPKETQGPGRLAEDDRGNIGWEWANDDVLQADDTLAASNACGRWSTRHWTSSMKTRRTR